MKNRIRDLWTNVRSSLWFVPALLAGTAIILAFTLIWVDETFNDLGRFFAWRYGGRAQSGRELLSVIAGSLITVASIAFSVTVIAIQQAATQYTPRLLQKFMRDRTNQIVLGTYVATFIYSLIVLQSVRDPTQEEEAFVPAISIAVSLALALISLGLLILFIHHNIRSLQVEVILQSLRGELMDALEQTLEPTRESSREQEAPFESQRQKLQKRNSDTSYKVRFQKEGYLRPILIEPAIADLKGRGGQMAIPALPGDYVFKGDLAIEVWPNGAFDKENETRLQQALRVGPQRNLDDDPLFGIRQIVDIAVKALSPSINDPTTAEQCLQQLGGILSEIGNRRFPETWIEINGWQIAQRSPRFDDYVTASFEQIRDACLTMPHVLGEMIRIIHRVSQLIDDPDRRAALDREFDHIKERLGSSRLPALDKTHLLETLSGIRESHSAIESSIH